MEEHFEICDENNQVIGTAPRSEVHAKGLYHRGVNIFIVNKAGHVFVQKRSMTKDTCPGMWDCIGEHLKPGETYDQAAQRGLQEELDLVEVKLERLREPKHLHFRYEDGKVENEFDPLYLVEAEGPFTLDPEEVEDGKFLPVQEIDAAIQNKTMQFARFFLAEWPEIKRRLM